MTSSATLEARHLIGLAERMCIPTDAAFRQVELLAERRVHRRSSSCHDFMSDDSSSGIVTWENQRQSARS